jgi:phospholipase C
MSITRRTVLTGAGGVVGAGALAAASPAASSARAPGASTTTAALPAPEASGIEHVVVVMMENRSFDHYLGWLPGARGRQAGLTFTDRYGVPHTTHHLQDTQGCAHPDPDHSFEGGRIELNGGACDGWLRAGENDEFAIGYYTDTDLDFYGRAARDWTVCDHYFSAIMAETYPNRFYQHAAQTDRIHNSTAVATMPTIWDRLAGAGVSGRYYFVDVPFTALWGTAYEGISSPFPRFLADAAGGTLPAVSFVDPKFLDEGTGSSAQKARVGDQYAVRHNPFMYLRSVTDSATCAERVVDLDALTTDLASSTTTPALSYITPNLCHDGHDAPCVDGEPGGLASADAFLRTWVPRITSSPAFQQDGALVITFDESDGPQTDATACCGEGPGPNSALPGVTGPGGGRVGALVLSRYVTPGSTSTTPYNHYSLLASIEDLWRLPHLGYAARPDLPRFGLDVWNGRWT